MDFLGIGPLELMLIVLIALIVLGPNDMIKTGKTIGKYLRKIVTSPNWKTIQKTSKEIKNLPTTLMREAGIDELKDQIPHAQTIRQDVGLDQVKKEMQSLGKDMSSWTTPPDTILPSPPIQPEREEAAPQAASEEPNPPSTKDQTKTD